LLGVITAVAIICISCFGLYSWWLRKPSEGTATDTTGDSLPASKGLLAGIVVLGILLPAAGISFVLIYIVEWFAGRVRRA
jgi:uncharacterized iron-regulated membrane protein